MIGLNVWPCQVEGLQMGSSCIAGELAQEGLLPTTLLDKNPNFWVSFFGFKKNMEERGGGLNLFQNFLGNFWVVFRWSSGTCKVVLGSF